MGIYYIHMLMLIVRLNTPFSPFFMYTPEI